MRSDFIDDKWDLRMLGLAKHYSGWSRDPSTKVGAVIARGKYPVAMGFNGFPAGLSDDPELYQDRETKYARIQHAEGNALAAALRMGVRVAGATIYTWPFPPCGECAKQIISSGIARVVSTPPSPDLQSRWPSLEVAKGLFQEAGIPFCLLEMGD